MWHDLDVTSEFVWLLFTAREKICVRALPLGLLLLLRSLTSSSHHVLMSLNPHRWLEPALKLRLALIHTKGSHTHNYKLEITYALHQQGDTDLHTRTSCLVFSNTSTERRSVADMLCCQHLRQSSHLSVWQCCSSRTQPSLSWATIWRDKEEC